MGDNTIETPKFVAAISCMDGRIQLPIIDWMKQTYRADFVDMITEAGPVKNLAEVPGENESIKKRLAISVHQHGSKFVAVVGHHDCAGNPVGRQTQLKQLYAAIKTIQSWGYPVTTIGLYVDENWQVHQIP
jgi:carbonic anhydrase